MIRNKRKYRVYEDQYVAEVKVEFITTGDEWSPYLSLEDADKLDDVREGLRQENLQIATKLANVFRLTPVAA